MSEATFADHLAGKVVTPMLAAILHDVRAYLRQYVVVTDAQAMAVTLWAAHTHVLAAADCTPYLDITSATAEAGKTRLLEALDLIVAKSWLTGRTSAAALVRKIDADGPTLLLDESDAAFKGDKDYAEALRGILNTGYRRSGKSTLCIGQGASLTVRDFSTFSPKAIAGIGKLPDTVVSRAIRIELRRRTKMEPVTKFRERDARTEAEPIRMALTTWANPRILTTLRAARPMMPDGLRDRAEDVLEPLFAIADLAGGNWGDDARTAAVALMGSTSDQDINVELLHDVAEVFGKTPFLKSGVLLMKLRDMETRPWADWKDGKPISATAVANRLKLFGIVPVRNEQGERGYFRDRFEDAWARYPTINPSSRQKLNKDGPELPISTRQDDEAFDGLEMQETPITTGLFDDLTGCDGGEAGNGADDGLPSSFVPPMGISRSAWMRHHQGKRPS